jgi:hypothetical protein
MKITSELLKDLGFYEPSWTYKKDKYFFFPKGISCEWVIEYPDHNEHGKEWRISRRHETGDMTVRHLNTLGQLENCYRGLFDKDLVNHETFNFMKYEPNK